MYPWRWVTLLFMFLMLGLAGHGWLADGLWAMMEERRWLTREVPGWASWAGLVASSLAIFLVLGHLALSERDRHGGWAAIVHALGCQLWSPDARGLLQQRYTWVAALSTLGLALGSGWVADGLLEAQYNRAVLGLPLLVAGAWGAYLKVPDALPLNSRLEDIDTAPARAMILPLSIFRLAETPGEGVALADLEGWSWEEATHAVDLDPAKAAGTSNLRPLIRAINHHRDTLEHLVLLRPDPEPDQAPTQSRVEAWLLDALHTALPGCRIRQRGPVEGIGFVQTYELINDTVEHLMHEARSRGRPLFHDEIVLDITGARTATSVATAAASLHNDVRFQYIDTCKLASTTQTPGRAVHTYDLSLSREGG